jgi:glucosylglycerate phosphorylase
MSAVTLGAAVHSHLRALYGEERGTGLAVLLEGEAGAFRAAHPRPPTPPETRLSEDDVLLIAYPDQVRAAGEAPLRTLERLLRGPLAGTVSGVHLLPFYPSSSDDGFSVVDYDAVDPDHGSWGEIAALARSHRLMFDAVINHVSARSAYLQGFLAGDPRFAGFFLETTPDMDLSTVVRPRTTPLATSFHDADGRRRDLWTTFSADQVDLDYHTPDVLLEVARVLLHYVARGAQLLRLDAVTYLWKEPGTTCASLPQTHAVLKVLRGLLEAAAPWVVVLTETNVPHSENVGYFGNGHDEAQMVYNFALPPLVLHSVLSGDASTLRSWAAGLATPSEATCFFNFLASHDGIGLRAVEGILDDAAQGAMVAAVQERGGRVSSRATASGERPYELNVNLFDALTPPGEALDASVQRFATVHAVMLALAGVPALYAHSLLGSRGAPDEVERTGRARSINREKLDLGALASELADAGGRRSRILAALRTLLQVRRAHPAFAPSAGQQVLPTEAGVFGVRREAAGRTVWCLHNLSDVPADVPGAARPRRARDLLGRGALEPSEALTLEPRQTLWLEER